MNTKKNKITTVPAELPQQVAANDAGDTSLHVSKLSLALDGKNILRDISFSLPAQGMNILIGPSGAGKSTLLRCLNLLHSDWHGELRIMGHDARCWPEGEDELRRSIGLIAQKPALFPCSIQQNIVFGLSRKECSYMPQIRIEKVLKQAALWDEVKNRLHDHAATLSVGQQQRLCIARALMLSPKMLLLDEPTASLDPRSKQFIETSLLELAQNMPVLCVTHDIEQAKRLGGQVIFMCDGHLIESGDSKLFFKYPNRIESREFLRWSVCDCS
ncbi:MAG: phosphate ABC transporter ATP-binding protein [Mariprofundus sp.]|nr:phosphate ABC transporter ATP-binding protein [Mariprofundus sp.]